MDNISQFLSYFNNGFRISMGSTRNMAVDISAFNVFQGPLEVHSKPSAISDRVHY